MSTSTLGHDRAHRPWSRAGICVAVLGVALVACDDRDISLQIHQAVPVDLSSCGASTDTGSSLGQGTVDLVLAQRYQLNVMVVNQMLDITQVKRYQPSDARIDTHDVLLTSATIEYKALDQITANLPQQLRVPINSVARIEGGLTPVVIEVLTPAMLDEIRNAPEFLGFDGASEVRLERSSVKVLLRVRLSGETMDGRKVESNEFVFPVEICNGCRVTYPPAAITFDPETFEPRCARDDPESLEFEEPPCPGFIGTDQNFIDCIQCQGYAVNRFARQLCQPPGE